MTDIKQDDTRPKPPPEAHEDKYRNEPPVEQLPKTGEKRQDKRVDERRHRPGKESPRDES